MSQVTSSSLIEATAFRRESPLWPPIVVGIVGVADSGKTQLTAALIRDFKMMSEEVRVAAIKHCPHGHDADREGSDTARFRDAGASSVIASSPGSVTTFSNMDGETELDVLLARLSLDHDVILVEGYKSSRIPKILLAGDTPSLGAIENVVATKGPIGASEFNIPNFTRADTAQLTAWIAANPALRLKTPSVSLRVDGVPVSLKRFPSEVLAGIVRGFVHSLSGVPDDYGRIEISVTPGNDAR